MASIIRIKRSSTAGNPATLGAGELAYSALADNGSNGGDRLYIGMGTETAGNAVNHVVIGGKYYTSLVDAGGSGGTLTVNAKSIPVLSATGTIDKWLPGNLQLTANTLSSTDTNGNINITPNGTGKTVISNAYIGDVNTSLAEYIYDTVGGAVTGGTGITITNSDPNNTSTVSITNTGVTAGSYGGASSIPVLTINAQGQITAASTANIATSLGIAGDSGTDTIALATDTLTFAGGTGIDSVVNSATNTVTFNIDSTVATLTGTQTLTNKTINLADNTLTATSAQLATAITDETGSGSLVFATSPTLVTPTLGVATATSINKVAITAPASSATLTIADGKTLTASNTLTLTGTDGSSVAFGAGGTVAYVADKLSAFAATTSAELAGVISDETGSGALVFATSPTLVTPTLGAATATSITGASGNLSITAAAGNNNVNLAPTGTGTVDVGSKRITSVAEPTQSTDAATKNYVDAVKTGLDVKDSVRVATTGNLTATYSNGTSGVGATLTNSGTQTALTIDSIVLSTGQRILVKDQDTALQNGIYVVTDAGSASTNWVITRATDSDNNPAGEIGPGAFTFVEEGTVNADNGFVCTTNGAITIGTTSIAWVQFSGAGQIVAGNGLTKSGNTLDAVGTANRITVTADAIDIASTYVGQTSITTLGTISTGTWQGNIVGSTYGGTGVNNGANTITIGGNISTGGAFTTSGAHALTLTLTAATNVTLPTTGTLATLAGTETLTNKTLGATTIAGHLIPNVDVTYDLGSATYRFRDLYLSGSSIKLGGATIQSSGASVSVGAIDNTPIGSTTASTGAFTTLTANGAVTLTSNTASTTTGTGALVVTGGVGVGGQINVGGATNKFTATTASSSTTTGTVVVGGGVGIGGTIYVGENITGAGAGTSTLDGFNIDGGTY